MTKKAAEPESIWECYSSAWKATSRDEKIAIFADCLVEDCTYNDPQANTSGWDELAEHMLRFHQQIPGGHFVTKYFMTHSDKSIAQWDMVDASGSVVGTGISYGEYAEDGKLKSMTGFF